jgi:hypothetical protein
MSSTPDGPGLSGPRQRPGHDLRLCPSCRQMSFDVADLRDGFVYCEFCGAEVAIAELQKTP